MTAWGRSRASAFRCAAPTFPEQFDRSTKRAGKTGPSRCFLPGRHGNFDYQTTSPTNLGFDLNTTGDNVTIVTSWWSSQWLQILDSTGTLFVP